MIIALVGAAILGVVTPYSDLFLNGTWIAACHLPIGAFMLFVILAAVVNVILRALARRLALSRAELLVSYCVMLAGAGIPSFGLTEYLIPTLAGAFYFQTPENNWVSIFYRYIPQWFVPVDLKAYPGYTGAMPGWAHWLYAHLPHWMQPASPRIVTYFYEGLPHSKALHFGQLIARVPWGAWLIPIAAWTVLAYVLFFLLLCVSVILRKQWVERERLTFPLVQLPLEIAGREDRSGIAAPFFRNRLMWLGFAIPMILHSVNSLHEYFPATPTFPVVQDLGQYFRTPPWNQIGMFVLWVHFSVIGFTFLLPTDLSFSLWFFYFFYKAEGIVAAAYGHEITYVPNYPVPTYAAMQMLGAFFALFAGMMYAARLHLRDVWHNTAALWRRDVTLTDDSTEPLPYRTAVLGGAAAILILATAFQVAGLNFFLGVLAFALFLVTAVVLTRFVAEGGLLFIQAPFRPSDVMITVVGTQPLGTQNLTLLGYQERALSLFDLRGFLMPFLTDIWRISDAAKLAKRRLVPMLGLGILVATVSSYATLLLLAYRHGAVNMGPWFAIWSPQQPWQVLKSYVEQPVQPKLANFELIAVGVAVMWALFWMRLRFVGWPFHPIGYAMGPSWPMIQLWFSILVGWLLKGLLLRLGGMRAYQVARPAFLGMVLGEFTAAGLWIVIDSITGLHGHRFFLT